MIFCDAGIESNKERNLYTKFFGHYFNEFVPGYDDRIGYLLDSVRSKLEAIPERLLSDLLEVPRELRVTFDLHAASFQEGDGPVRFPKEVVDRGEAADMCVETDDGALVSFEFKYLSNWGLERDVHAPMRRMKVVAGHGGRRYAGHVLLVTEQKWRNVVRRKHKGNSQYQALLDRLPLDKPLLVFTWEQFLDSPGLQPRVVEWTKSRLRMVGTKANPTA